MVAGRSSIGYELDEEFVQLFEERVEEAPKYSREVLKQRVDDHKEFVERRLAEGNEFNYEADNYDFPVTTKQEKPIQFYSVSEVRRTDDGYEVTHEPVEGTAVQIEEANRADGVASLSDF
jgi:hypothetical protein